MDRLADGVRRPAQPSSSAAFQNTTSPFDLPQPLSEAASSSPAAAAAAAAAAAGSATCAAAAAAAAPAGSATCAAAASSSADAARRPPRRLRRRLAARRPPMWPGGGAASADAPAAARAAHLDGAAARRDAVPAVRGAATGPTRCAVCGVDAPDRPPPPEEDEEVQYVLVDFSESRLPPETLRAFLTSREHAFDNMLTPTRRSPSGTRR